MREIRLRRKPGGGTMSDKRCYRRLRKRLQLKFGIDMPNQVAFTEDISLQGICIKTAMVRVPGSRLKIDLMMPDGNVTRLAGVVMWAKKVPPRMLHLVKKCGMGVKIIRVISGEEAYRNFCEEQREQ